MQLDNVKLIVAQVLALDPRALHADTPLLGSVPALDSMAVVQLLAALEEHYGCALDDDELSAATFATVGTLTDFVHRQAPA